MTPEEQRQVRLKNDYEEMKKLHGEMIRVEAVGDPPEQYSLKVRIRSIIGPDPNYRSEHEIRVELPSGYPRKTAPEIVMVSQPPPFHPNWWADGRWCYGSWNRYELLGHHVLRMVRTLQFDTEITNPGSPANTKAAMWYLRQLRQGLFPCDRQILPDPSESRFIVRAARQLKFVMNPISAIRGIASGSMEKRR